eukprot:scaffold171180_cov30-Tisochrysis_lutea.AAC.4
MGQAAKTAEGMAHGQPANARARGGEGRAMVSSRPGVRLICAARPECPRLLFSYLRPALAQGAKKHSPELTSSMKEPSTASCFVAAIAPPPPVTKLPTHPPAVHADWQAPMPPCSVPLSCPMPSTSSIAKGSSSVARRQVHHRHTSRRHEEECIRTHRRHSPSCGLPKIPLARLPGYWRPASPNLPQPARPQRRPSQAPSPHRSQTRWLSPPRPSRESRRAPRRQIQRSSRPGSGLCCPSRRCAEPVATEPGVSVRACTRGTQTDAMTVASSSATVAGETFGSASAARNSNARCPWERFPSRPP